MIPTSVSRWFASDIRARGEALVGTPRVRRVSAEPDRLQAIVTGTAQYRVEMVATPRTLRLSCSCPYADHGGACKHLWAVLRTCDAEGTLASLLSVAGRPHEVLFGDDVALEDEGGAPPLPTPSARGVRPPRPAAPRPASPPPPPSWQRVLDAARIQMQLEDRAVLSERSAEWPANRRLVYILDCEASAIGDGVVIELGTEKRNRDGTWADARRFTLGTATWFATPEPVDRQVAEMLCGADEPYGLGGRHTSSFRIPPRSYATTLHTILDTGRCRLRSSSRPEVTGTTLHADDGPPWTFRMRVERDPAGTHAVVGVLARDDSTMPLDAPLLVHSSGVLIAGDRLAKLDAGGAFTLLQALRVQRGALTVAADLPELLSHLFALPRLPALELPAGASLVESHAPPVPGVTIQPRAGWLSAYTCDVTCTFGYGSQRVEATAASAALFDPDTGVLHQRQPAAERAALTRLAALGVLPEYDIRRGTAPLAVARRAVPSLARTLLGEGWRVSVDGLRFVVPGAFRASVSSGVDWFDLRGTVRYGDVDVPIATILEAQRRGESFVPVADGAMGLMPDAWLAQLGPLLGAGHSMDGGVRYRRSQLSLLDALLATLPPADVDATFAQARAALARFATVTAAEQPSSFRGTLRGYQREGLGWLHFLREFGLGGCLADDMGLGKTVQVLALLEARRVDGHGPSLVVVPRSLVFNWLREAERFTPALRLLDFSGSARDVSAIDAARVDVVVATYGSLRRDAPLLAGIEFDYAILDEAQAIKNAGTATAKASRLVRARHRLAMSGTPIENRVEELWSLFEFLNPGMLGASTSFAALARQSADGLHADDITTEPTGGVAAGDRTLLARALRPVILRRTKEAVAPELPERVEQTLEVELEPKQRKFYDGIHALARRTVMAQVDRQGLRKSQMHILEALLRLRQAACHPALVDASKAALPSAKLDALVPLLASVAEEGHKSLVFSQFTSFLSLVRDRLDAAGVRYEYLDGRTRDRQARVDRFQQDASCPVFLISLKAGGHGLNLTSADYVYLLDPWWNPAVEAQAIDRAHRIGQARRVVATRLVARDTIEAKILALQTSKRALADAVLTADRGGLASIGREELELLLG